jgi:hypothetical protein
MAASFSLSVFHSGLYEVEVSRLAPLRRNLTITPTGAIFGSTSSLVIRD